MWSILRTVKTIQVVLEADLLVQADEAASRAGTNRSVLIRDALREHLKRLTILRLEEQHRLGYERFPDVEDDLNGLEAAAAWDE